MAAQRIPYRDSSYPTQRLFTPEEYLRVERQAETKSEYIDGIIYAMAGASYSHIVVVSNFAGELRNKPRGTGCQSLVGDMKVQVGKRTLTRKPEYFYPDIAVVCGEPDLTDDGYKDLLRNPLLIVEVLSPSTEDYDRGTKYERFQNLESLREVVLVAQDRFEVTTFVRPEVLSEPSVIKGLRVVKASATPKVI